MTVDTLREFAPSPHDDHDSGSARSSDLPSLSQKFPSLKSLQVDLEFLDPAGVDRLGCMKYKPNLAHATSVFWFGNPSPQPSGHGFDLDGELSGAIAAQRTVISGQLYYPFSSAPQRKPDFCLLRFKLTLDF